MSEPSSPSAYTLPLWLICTIMFGLPIVVSWLAARALPRTSPHIFAIDHPRRMLFASFHLFRGAELLAFTWPYFFERADCGLAVVRPRLALAFYPWVVQLPTVVWRLFILLLGSSLLLQPVLELALQYGHGGMWPSRCYIFFVVLTHVGMAFDENLIGPSLIQSTAMALSMAVPEATHPEDSRKLEPAPLLHCSRPATHRPFRRERRVPVCGLVRPRKYGEGDEEASIELLTADDGIHVASEADAAAKNAGEVDGGADEKKYKCVAGGTAWSIGRSFHASFYLCAGAAKLNARFLWGDGLLISPIHALLPSEWQGIILRWESLRLCLNCGAACAELLFGVLMFCPGALLPVGGAMLASAMHVLIGLSDVVACSARDRVLVQYCNPKLFGWSMICVVNLYVLFLHPRSRQELKHGLGALSLFRHRGARARVVHGAISAWGLAVWILLPGAFVLFGVGHPKWMLGMSDESTPNSRFRVVHRPPLPWARSWHAGRLPRGSWLSLPWRFCGVARRCGLLYSPCGIVHIQAVSDTCVSARPAA